MSKIQEIKRSYIMLDSLCNAYIQSHIINSFIISLAVFLEADSLFTAEDADNEPNKQADNGRLQSLNGLTSVPEHKYRQGGGYMENKNKPNDSKSNELIIDGDEVIKEKTAVALSYDPADSAPRVIASGKGYVAEKIIQKARETDIPVHKDEKLANTLSKLEIGEMIPPQLYDVVAEILVFVDKMDKIKKKVKMHEQ